MKRVMFVVLSLLVASAVFATESGPSNKVGYTKINALGGAGTVSTPFGIAFQTWDVPVGNVPSYGVNSSCPSDIFGDQPNCGRESFGSPLADRILRQDNGDYGFRNNQAACAWGGGLETNCSAVPGRAYWYQNKTGVDRPLVVAGEVNNSGNYANIAMTELGFTAYAWRDSRDLNIDDLNLVAAGFVGGPFSFGAGQSDRVIDQNNGLIGWRTAGGIWNNNDPAALYTMVPGHAFWIQNKDHANNTWNYNYDASGGTLSVPGDTKETKGGADIQVISAPKPAAKTSAASK